MLQLSDQLLYLTRDEWDDSGARRLGSPVPIQDHTEAWQHHTVGIDNDATPNQWGGIADCKRRMRFLRTVRPDLGEDIPYTWVGFLMEKAFQGEGGLVVCEGRGPGRRGAHTKYHNRTGVALALDGNFEDYSIDLTPWIPQLSRFWSWAKYEIPIPNLATVTPQDAYVWGHQQSGASTACPGIFMMSKLPQVTIDRPQEEDDMAFARIIKYKSSDTKTYLWRSNTKELLHMKSRQQREQTAELYGISKDAEVVSKDTLAAL